MKRILTLACLCLFLAAQASAQTAEPVARTLNASFEKVWAISESVLKSLGWDIDERDKAVGWIVTDSRGVDFKDFGVYGEGIRHKLRLRFKAVGENRTSVSVEREVYREERILWMRERKPVQTQDRSVEVGVLNAIEKAI